MEPAVRSEIWAIDRDQAINYVDSLEGRITKANGASRWYTLVLGSLAGAAVRSAMFLRGETVWPVFRLGGVGRHVTYGGALAMSRLAWQVINQSDVPDSPILKHPLAPEGGGDEFHSGGRQFKSKTDGDWKTIYDWARSAK